MKAIEPNEKGSRAAIGCHALPVNVVFLTLAGAELGVSALRETWPLALFRAAFGIGLTALGTVPAAWLGGMPEAGMPRKLAWRWDSPI